MVQCLSYFLYRITKSLTTFTNLESLSKKCNDSRAQISIYKQYSSQCFVFYLINNVNFFSFKKLLISKSIWEWICYAAVSYFLQGCYERCLSLMRIILLFFCRYKFNIGPLLALARNELKWAESRKVKEEFDLQVRNLCVLYLLFVSVCFVFIICICVLHISCCMHRFFITLNTFYFMLSIFKQ